MFTVLHNETKTRLRVALTRSNTVVRNPVHPGFDSETYSRVCREWTNASVVRELKSLRQLMQQKCRGKIELPGRLGVLR